MANRFYSAFTREQGVGTPVQPGLRRFAIVAGALLLIAGGLALRTLLLPGEPGRGALDGLSFGDVPRKVIVTGWAGVHRRGAQLIAVAVYVGKEELYASTPEPWERPDVASAFNRPEWLNSGWRLSAALSPGLEKGRYPVRARALLDNGEEFDLSVVDSVKEIEVP